MNMLKRMAERKEIKRQEFEVGSPDWFMLNSTEKKTKWRFAHESAAADLFSAYYPYMEAWVFEPFILTKRADRGMRINGLTVYFEIDLCTEGISILQEKIENYVAYSRETGERFHVVFSFLGEQAEVQRRGNLLIPHLQDLKRGHQFLLVNHQKLVNQPLEPVLYSPKDEILSINSL